MNNNDMDMFQCGNELGYKVTNFFYFKSNIKYRRIIIQLAKNNFFSIFLH